VWGRVKGLAGTLGVVTGGVAPRRGWHPNALLSFLQRGRDGSRYHPTYLYLRWVDNPSKGHALDNPSKGHAVLSGLHAGIRCPKPPSIALYSYSPDPYWSIYSSHGGQRRAGGRRRG